MPTSDERFDIDVSYRDPWDRGWADVEPEPKSPLADYVETGWCPRHRRTYTGNFFACPECGERLVMR